MAYGYNPQSQNLTAPAQQNPQLMMQPQQPQQNVQPLFPQPQGNVYNINSTLEVANVPVGAGVSVALCLPENVMYIKTMQNGNPLFYPYKIMPFNQEVQEEKTPTTQINIETLAEQLQFCVEKIQSIEAKINSNKQKQNNTPKGVDWEL